MTPRSRTGSPTRFPRASSPTSTATAASCPRRRPLAELLTALALALALLPACAYLNTFYNARQAFDEGERLAAGSDSLPTSAAEAFRVAAEKSAIVIERYPDSEYVDDALFLMAESFYRLGSWADAAASYERYSTRFPEGERASDARLGWARAERRLGDHAAAEAALAPLLGAGRGEEIRSDVVYEQALILLATGQRDRAAETYRRLLAEHPEFAADRELTLEFADAELAAGQYASALEAYRTLAAAVGDPQRRREIEIRAARALALEGRADEALAAYDGVLTATVADSQAAEVEVERGELLERRGDRDAAVEAYQRVAELAPGSAAASRATLHRGRIVWKQEERREEALDILLDAFIHSPVSAWGDSARNESRELARLLHFQRIADGEVPVPQIEDVSLARSTAMYRLAEEILEVEGDREAAAEMFWQLVERYPESPWRPWAMLASGLLLSQADGGAPAPARDTGVARLLQLVEADPDHPAADSARRELGLEVPERPNDFYATDPTLAVLARVLPREADPMIGIEDQMNRYGGRGQSSRARLRGTDRALEVERERQSGQPPAGQEPEGQAPPGDEPPAEGAPQEGDSRT
jgi:tetratricopeptide (TPR) repeat protein